MRHCRPLSAAPLVRWIEVLWYKNRHETETVAQILTETFRPHRARCDVPFVEEDSRLADPKPEFFFNVSLQPTGKSRKLRGSQAGIANETAVLIAGLVKPLPILSIN